MIVYFYPTIERARARGESAPSGLCQADKKWLNIVFKLVEPFGCD